MRRTSTSRRRWWLRPAGAVIAVVVLTLALAAPAQATLAEQYWFAKLSISKAWTVSKGAGVTVAVVDTGVVPTLPDLRGQVLPGVNLSGSSAKDGRSDAGSGCNEYGGCVSHGTQMALTIAGTGKGLGFTGVAPQAKIMPVKIATRDGADFLPSTVARGIRYAVDHGAQVINVSLDTAASCDPDEAAAVKYAYQHDVIVVASTGNVGGPVGSPANCPGALAIGGIDANFKPWKLTNYGPETDFVGAADNTVQESLNGTKLTGGSGTSNATAVVAATFALIRSHSPDLSARDAVTHALNNVHNGTGKFGTRLDDKLGYGEILPYFAMTFDIGANAPNPIYDAWERELGPATPSSSSSSAPSIAPSSASSSASSVPTSSAAPSNVPTNGGITVGGSSGDAGSSSTGLVIGIVVVVVVLLGAAGVVIGRRRSGHAT